MINTTLRDKDKSDDRSNYFKKLYLFKFFNYPLYKIILQKYCFLTIILFFLQ